MEYVIYVVDTETTGLLMENDIIELSLYRLKDDCQKTWCLKPSNIDLISMDALRVNGHKLEDLKHETKYGRDTYRDPNKVIIEIENWIMEDDVPSENRILCAQNILFDKPRLEELWNRCGARDSFPFGRRVLDTMIIEFFLDLCKGQMAEGYSLNNIIKKYGLKNDKAHTAAADTKVCREVLDKQIESVRKLLNK